MPALNAIKPAPHSDRFTFDVIDLRVTDCWRKTSVQITMFGYPLFNVFFLEACISCDVMLSAKLQNDIYFFCFRLSTCHLPSPNVGIAVNGFRPESDGDCCIFWRVPSEHSSRDRSECVGRTPDSSRRPVSPLGCPVTASICDLCTRVVGRCDATAGLWNVEPLFSHSLHVLESFHGRPPPPSPLVLHDQIVTFIRYSASLCLWQSKNGCLKTDRCIWLNSFYLKANSESPEQ